MHQRIHTFIAIAAIAAVGIGASYMIVRVANNTDFSYISTDESITITAEIKRRGGDVQAEETQ